MKLARIVIFLMLLASLPSLAYSRIWYVNLERTGDAPTIQAAIESSAVGDTVLVAPGTYNRANQDMLDYGLVVGLIKEVYLLSEAGPQQTILDAEGEVIVVNIQSSEYGDISPTIEGFTVMDGSADFADFGAGIRCWYTSPTIKNCIIRDNWVFRDGGGLACWYANATVTGNVFVNNSSAVGGGAGIFCRDSAALITNNTLVGNTSHVGGVIDCNSSPSVTISNNIISHSLDGPALFCSVGTPTITCNCFWANPGGSGACSLGTGNFTADPRYCDFASGDYSLHEDSPCAPENAPSGCGLIGAMPIGCWDTPVGALPGAVVTVALGAAGAMRVARSNRKHEGGRH